MNMKRKRGRPSLKKRVKVTLTLEEDVYYEAREYIENVSAYLNRCLSNYLIRVRYPNNNYIPDDNFRQDWTAPSHNRQNVYHKKSTLSRKSSDRQSAMLNDYTHDTWEQDVCQEISDEDFDKILESL